MVLRRSPTQKDGFATASPAAKGLVSGLIDSVSALVSLCARQARRLAPPRKPRPKALLGGSRPKETVAPEFPQPTRGATAAAEKEEKGRSSGGEAAGGREGVWQREILMGDRCRPLRFSGVIYYDKTGKQLSELPLRSPRLPLPHG